jgi:hypothetical protein
MRGIIVRMASVRKKKSKEKKQNGEAGVHPVRLSNGALRSVFAIFFVAIAGFLVLAEVGIGGVGGNEIFRGLSWLLGIGYLLLPLSLVLLAIIILRSFERHFGAIQILGMAVFLLSGLGLINLAFHGKGGIVGIGITTPLVAAIDSIATAIFLLAFIIASLVIAFDVHLGELLAAFRALLSQNETPAMETPLSEVPVVGLTKDEEEPAVTQMEDTSEKPKSAMGGFFKKADDAECLYAAALFRFSPKIKASRRWAT